MSYLIFCPTLRIFSSSNSGLNIESIFNASSRSSFTAMYQASFSFTAKLNPTNSASIGCTEVVSVSKQRISFVRKKSYKASALSTLSMRWYSCCVVLMLSYCSFFVSSWPSGVISAKRSSCLWLFFLVFSAFPKNLFVRVLNSSSSKSFANVSASGSLHFIASRSRLIGTSCRMVAKK